MTGLRTTGLLLIAVVLVGGCQARAQPRLVAAQLSYGPGDEAETELWTLSIGNSGRVRQTWEDWGGRRKPDHPPRESTLSADQRREFLERLDPQRMARFGDTYKATGVTDLLTITLTLITDVGSRTIATYGLDLIADDSNDFAAEERKRWPKADEASDLLGNITWLMARRPAR